jgi:hypothetical protein
MKRLDSKKAGREERDFPFPGVWDFGERTAKEVDESIRKAFAEIEKKEAMRDRKKKEAEQKKKPGKKK